MTNQTKRLVTSKARKARNLHGAAAALPDRVQLGIDGSVWPRKKTAILEKPRWEGSEWLQEPTARRVSRLVSRPRLLRTMQRKGPCLST